VYSGRDLSSRMLVATGIPVSSSAAIVIGTVIADTPSLTDMANAGLGPPPVVLGTHDHPVSRAPWFSTVRRPPLFCSFNNRNQAPHDSPALDYDPVRAVGGTELRLHPMARGAVDAA